MEQFKVSKVVLLWGGVVIIFVALIIFVLVQMSPRRNDHMTATMEQAFPTELEVEPESELDPVVPQTSETQNAKSPMLTGEKSPAVEKNVSGERVATTVQKEPAAIQDKTLSWKGAERAMLLETGEQYWNVLIPEKVLGLGSVVWQTILIQNKSKLDYVIMPERGGENWVLVWEGKKLKIQFLTEKENKKDILSRKQLGKYAVQLLSVEEDRFSRAVEIVRMLINDGYYAYIYKTTAKYKEKFWYRVRIGFFKTVDEAQTTGQEVYFRYKDSQLFPNDYWAVQPSAWELSKELIDLRIPINKPWMLELPHDPIRERAVARLPVLGARSDFVYISQKRDAVTGQVMYRTRLGFFETQSEAKQKLEAFTQVHTLFADAKVVQL